MIVPADVRHAAVALTVERSSRPRGPTARADTTQTAKETSPMATTLDADHRSHGSTRPRQRHPARRAASLSRSSRSSSFRTDVEGLRAVGVLLVVAFHASVPHLAGGFTGVDVFFVISGFLITGLLVREGVTRGRISLQDFYARRIRRILPAACLVLVATVPLMALTFDPLRSYRSLLDLGAALLYVSNWRFIHQNNDYLAASNDHSPALHYWSLSVEEQFYLVWPLLVLLAVVVCRRYRWRVSRVAFALLGLVTVASYVANLRLTASDPGLAYLATQTRAWQFGVGGLLAVLVYAGPSWLSARLTGGVRWVVGWAGLVAVAGAAYTYTNSTPYPGVHALAPTLGTAAIIFAGSTATGGQTSTWSVSRVLSLPPIRWIGRMSYAWYLWHWPLIVCAEAKWPDIDLVQRIGVMLVALGLAWLTHLLLERPLIGNGLLRRSRPATVALGVVATLVTAGVLVPSALASRGALGDQAHRASGLSFAQAFGTTTRTSGAVSPSVLTATQDRPPRPECLLAPDGRRTPDTCVFGPKDGTPVVLFGDSHAQQWQSTFAMLADKHDWRLTVLTHGGCSPSVVYSLAGATKTGRACAGWREDQLRRIPTLKPSIVFISALNQYTTDPAKDRSAWRETFNRLDRGSTKLVYLADTPFPHRDVPSCVSGHLDDWAACDIPRTGSTKFDYVAQERSVVLDEFPKVTKVDLSDVLCTARTCPVARNGVLVYRDFSHLTDTAARLLAVPLEKRLERKRVLQAAG